MNLKTIALAVFCITTIAAQIEAQVAPATVRFDPSFETVNVGNSFLVDILISDFAAGGPPSVGAFDFGITYDPVVLSPAAVTFGVLLGGPAHRITSLDLATSGLVQFSEISLLPSAELDALQPAGFGLVTIEFNALAIGTSILDFDSIGVSDSFGTTVPSTGLPANVSVVPEPSSAVVALVCGLGVWTGGLMIRRRRLAQPG